MLNQLGWAPQTPCDCHVLMKFVYSRTARVCASPANTLTGGVFMRIQKGAGAKAVGADLLLLAAVRGL